MGDTSDEQIGREARDAVGARRPARTVFWRRCVATLARSHPVRGTRNQARTRNRTTNPDPRVDLSAGPQFDILPGHGLDMLGRALESCAA